MQDKRIEVDLTMQTLTALSMISRCFKTHISSGIPNGRAGRWPLDKDTLRRSSYSWIKCPLNIWRWGICLRTQTIMNSPAFPWTCFFTRPGHAFHGTYWHENLACLWPRLHQYAHRRSQMAVPFGRSPTSIRQVRQPRHRHPGSNIFLKHAAIDLARKANLRKPRRQSITKDSIIIYPNGLGYPTLEHQNAMILATTCL